MFSAAGAFRLKESARLETKSTKRMALRSGGFGWGIRHLPWWVGAKVVRSDKGASATKKNENGVPLFRYFLPVEGAS